MDWVERFDGLAQIDASVHRTLIERAKVMRVPAGTEIFGPGKAPDTLLLLLEGTVRVQQIAESGREIVLYRVQSGESCILTTACLLSHEAYSAEGIAESDVEAVAIPRVVFDDLIARSEPFRSFVFNAYAQRITDLFVVIEQVAFGRVDIRLAQRLLALGDAVGRIRATHQQMANELGTAREVVSRQLSEFQRRGWVELSRGEITLCDQNGLQGLANAD